MFSKNDFMPFLNKEVHVIMSGCSMLGKIIDCNDRYLTLSTRFSDKRFILISKIDSFWEAV